MTTITDENGIMNNFASEPKIYYAEALTSQEQLRYMLWGAIALVIVAASAITAVVVS
jgi:hypothetical protein